MKLIKTVFIFALLTASACTDSPQPKPAAHLALNYDEATYLTAKLECPFYFEQNKQSVLKIDHPNQSCWLRLDYPKMKAKIYLTYSPVENNLKELLLDAQKLPEKHTIKADFIEVNVYEDSYKRVYGNFYEVEGDAASQAQFYLTDSTSHFLTGSIYFDAQPNYDSILPAASYLKNDLKHLVETLEWK